jgi:hypothetical protein
MNVKNIIFGISKRYEKLIRINSSLRASITLITNNTIIYRFTYTITYTKNIQIIGTNTTYFSVFTNNQFINNN